MVVLITDIVKMALSVTDISAEPIIGTPLVCISCHDLNHGDYMSTTDNATTAMMVTNPAIAPM